jgi:hypothetical protein
MAFLFKFEKDSGILFVSHRGVLSDAKLVELQGALERVYLAHRPHAIVFDWSGATAAKISCATVTAIAHSSSISPEVSRIHIAPQDVIYGCFRMFQSLAHKTRPNMHVVRTPEEVGQILRRRKVGAS